MKKVLVFLVFFILFVGSAFAKFSTGLPTPTNYVNDYADVISQPVEDQINSKLDELKKTTTSEVAVVTIKSLGGASSIEEYSISLAEEWKPGTEGEDNGIIMLFAMDDRQMRIEVGQGLEHKITDVRASHILDKTIKPEFQAGDYDSGITKGVDEVINAITSSDSATTTGGETQQAADETDSSAYFIIAILFVVFIVFIVAISSDSGGHGSSSGGLGFSTGFIGGSLSSGLSSSSSSSSSGSSWGGFSGGSFSGGGASGGW